MDRAHDIGPWQTVLGKCQGGACADDLGAVHVVVDDLRRSAAQQVDDRAEGSMIVQLIDDMHGHPGGAQAAHRRPVGEADHLDVEARGIKPPDEILDVHLSAATGRGGHDLGDRDSHAASTSRTACSPERRTSSRSMTSSRAPHSYL